MKMEAMLKSILNKTYSNWSKDNYKIVGNINKTNGTRIFTGAS
jgi:predicted nucleic acid-binding protein